MTCFLNLLKLYMCQKNSMSFCLSSSALKYFSLPFNCFYLPCLPSQNWHFLDSCDSSFWLILHTVIHWNLLWLIQDFFSNFTPFPYPLTSTITNNVLTTLSHYCSSFLWHFIISWYLHLHSFRQARKLKTKVKKSSKMVVGEMAQLRVSIILAEAWSSVSSTMCQLAHKSRKIFRPLLGFAGNCIHMNIATSG